MKIQCYLIRHAQGLPLPQGLVVSQPVRVWNDGIDSQIAVRVWNDGIDSQIAEPNSLASSCIEIYLTRF